jgi:hypothetical protein
MNYVPARFVEMHDGRGTWRSPVLKTRRTGHDEVNSKNSPEEEDGEEESGGSVVSWCVDGEDGE